MVGGVRDYIKILSKTNTINDYSKSIHAHNVHGARKEPRKSKIKIKLKNTITGDIQNVFEEEEGY